MDVTIATTHSACDHIDNSREHVTVMSGSGSHMIAREPIERPKPSCSAMVSDESMRDEPETIDWDASSVTPVVAAKPDVCMYINV